MAIERQWDRVEECYFGNAGYPSHAAYRVAEDGGVQRKVEFGVTTTSKAIGPHGAYTHKLPIIVEEIGHLNDIQVELIIKEPNDISAWYIGWTDDLNEDELKGYRRDLEDSLGFPTVTSWADFIGNGIARRV